MEKIKSLDELGVPLIINHENIDAPKDFLSPPTLLDRLRETVKNPKVWLVSLVTLASIWTIAQGFNTNNQTMILLGEIPLFFIGGAIFSKGGRRWIGTPFSSDSI